MPGEVVFKFDMGKVVKVYIVDGGIQAHDPKTHGLSTTPFIKEPEGISPFDHLQKVNQLPTQTKPSNTQILPRHTPPPTTAAAPGTRTVGADPFRKARGSALGRFPPPWLKQIPAQPLIHAIQIALR